MYLEDPHSGNIDRLNCSPPSSSWDVSDNLSNWGTVGDYADHKGIHRTVVANGCDFRGGQIFIWERFVHHSNMLGTRVG